MKIALLASGFLVMLIGCAALNDSPSVQARIALAQNLAKTSGWTSAIIHTDAFDLQAYESPRHIQAKSQAEAPLTVYIEGDGHAWADRQTPSEDPTPIDPIALRMALEDKQASVVYLGRPCQYVGAKSAKICNARYWTSYRFSAEVVQATSQAIDVLKARYGAKKLILIGYSGGGTIALLLAAKREDVLRVLTVAGNVDVQAWVDYHGLTPLGGSLNPVDFLESLSKMEQIHYVGEGDRNIPAEITRAYVSKFPIEHQPKIIIVPKYTHTCCWGQDWGGIK
jgi:hypothetical protein